MIQKVLIRLQRRMSQMKAYIPAASCFEKDLVKSESDISSKSHCVLR